MITELDDCRLPTLKARVPASLVTAVDAYGSLIGDSRSGALRDLLVSALTERGLWPPRVAGVFRST